MTNLINMTKAQINALLASPLTASALKKKTHADLVALFDAMHPTDALGADLRDARADDPTPTPEQVLDDSEQLTPTLQTVLDGLTDLEKAVLVAHLEAGMACNGAETLDSMRADNMTWSDIAETSKRTGLTKKQVNGVLASLSGKRLVVTDCDRVNGEGAVQQVLDDFGIVVAFELLADGVEAKAKQAAPKPAPAPKKVRVLDDRIITQPATDAKHVKAVTQGSKRHLLIQALEKGATIDDLMTVTGWGKDTVTSALRWDVAQAGLGCERKGGKYFLMLPKGFTKPAIVEKGQEKGDVLLAARGD
jgi:hypothetical protein